MKRLLAGLSSKTGFRRALILVTVLAIGLRIGACVALGFGRAPDGTSSWADQNFFENLAWSLSQGAGFVTPEGVPTAFQAPGFPFLLAALYRIFGHHYALNSVLQSLLGGFACLFAGLMARQIGLRPAIAIAAAFIAATLPSSLQVATGFTSEAPAQFFVALMSFLLAVAMAKGDTVSGRRFLWAAGLACGYGALIRPQMLAVPLFVGVCLVLSRRLPLIRAVWWGVSFGLVAAAVIAPWTARNWIVMGGWAPIATSGGQTYLSANNPYTLNPADERFGYTELSGIVTDARKRVTLQEPNEIKRDALDYKLGKEFRAASAVNPVKLAMARLHRLLKYTTTAPGFGQKAGYFLDSLMLVPWFLIGLLVVLGSKRLRVRFIPVYVHLLTLGVVTFMYFGSIRYRSAYGPELAVLTAVSIAWFMGLLRGGMPSATAALLVDGEADAAGSLTT